MLACLEMMDDPKDKLKFEQIYGKYRGFVFHAAFGILQNRQDAEDAAQDAFLCLAKNISKIPALDSAKTRGLILVIIERKCIDLLRQQRRHVSEELLEEQIGSLVPEPEDHDLAWCISQLPPRYREIILLKYSQGYSTREAAELLGISFDAASKLDQRAKKRLEALCRKEGIL